jgi:hypothetical protein
VGQDGGVVVAGASSLGFGDSLTTVQVTPAASAITVGMKTATPRSPRNVLMRLVE